MLPGNDVQFAQLVHGNVVATTLRFLAAALFLTLLNFSPAFSQNTYSDSWVDDSGSGIIVSAGVTDGSYTHSYVVDTTVTSPNGRSAFGSRRYTGYARANATLAWDWADPGDYFTESEHSARCPGDDLNYYSIGTTSMSIRIAIAITNYIFNGLEGGYCRYDLWCPNGNASATCPASNPVYASPSQNICRNYLHDYRLKTTIGGSVFCSAVGKANLANFALPCS